MRSTRVQHQVGCSVSALCSAVGWLGQFDLGRRGEKIWSKSVWDPAQRVKHGGCSSSLERLKACAVLMCCLLQGYYFCVKQYALECSRIPMGQSVNSQVMALQAQLVLLRVRSCFGGGSYLWGRMGISGAASSGELCSLFLEKQSCTEPAAATCPPRHAA